jgi:uncharacterized OB-fold protein
MTTQTEGNEVQLTAPYVLEYAYKRTLGPILSQFFTAMRDGKVLGAKLGDGRVMVPPTEYDPDTGDELTELVEVGDVGVVTTWSWVAKPRRVHPLDTPFGWALIKLDGADTAMLHVVDAPSADAMKTGMRVKARWRGERVGFMTDIECFEPEVSE